MRSAGTIVQGGRALIAALQPLTGNRAVGQIRMRARAGQEFTIQRFSYFLPVVGNTAQQGWMFKIGPGPNEDESWTIGEDDVLVDAYSNVGGARMNLPEGTGFAPESPIPELEIAEAASDFEGADNPADDFTGVRDIVFFESVETTELKRSPLSQFPGVLIAFDDLTPADGVTTAQTNQGSVNLGDGAKQFKLNYTISVLTTRTDSEARRRLQGVMVIDDILKELVDRHCAPDGEPLSNPSGVQVRRVIRERGNQQIYQHFHIYTALVSITRAITRTERRTFAPWLRSNVTAVHPQDPAEENQGDLEVVSDMVVDMAAYQIDLTHDGVFERDGDATYWDGTELLSYEPDERRTWLGSVLLEPEIASAFADPDTFDAWTVDQAEVFDPSESNPAGYSDTAQVISFEASADAQINIADMPAMLGAPITFYVFAKAHGPDPQIIRLGVFDGVEEHESADLVVSPTQWKRLRFEVVPATSNCTLRIMNGSDGTAKSVVLWGAFFDVHARWGAELALAKPRDVLWFYPPGAYVEQSMKTPLSVLKGRFKVVLRTLPYVPADMTGNGLSAAPLVVCLGGTSDLLRVELSGTPSTGGARLDVYVRGRVAPAQSLTRVRWSPGATLEFTFDAHGSMELKGTREHDGVYALPRYDAVADLNDDRLIFGTDSAGDRGAVPGFYAVVVDV